MDSDNKCLFVNSNNKCLNQSVENSYDSSESIEDAHQNSKLEGNSRLHETALLKSNHGNYSSNFKISKTWEGCVDSIDGENITSRLYDPEENSYSIFEFSKFELKTDDQKLLKKGALFFLYLGYFTKESGQVLKSSYIEFRRFPKIS